MTLYTLLLIAVVILLFYIKKKIADITKTVEAKIDTVKQIMDHPRELVESVGGVIADTAVSKAAELFSSRKKKRK